MYVLGGAELLEGVVCGFDKIRLCECHDACLGVDACGYVPLYTKHESRIANLYLEPLVEFSGYVFEVSHAMAMSVAIVGVDDDE